MKTTKYKYNARVTTHLVPDARKFTTLCGLPSGELRPGSEFFQTVSTDCCKTCWRIVAPMLDKL